MVVRWILLMLIAVSPLFGEIRVQAEADQVDHFENLPVPVTIIITHPPDQVVDESSFTLGKDKIVVEKVKDVGDPNGKEDILTIYHYDLTNQAKGLHILPSIHVKVGNSVYKSVASTFEVKAMSTAIDDSPPPIPASNPSSSSSGGTFLRLENIVEGSKTLYPGQTITLGYRYSYNADIETTDEITPLFEPKGFLKVGDKIVKHKDSDDTSILEVTQQLQAVDPGVFQIGPSSIEGYVYKEEGGRRTYSKAKLKSVTPVVTLTVNAIPADDKPASFNGAVGKYTFKVSLQSSPTVTVGDEMSLLVEITGTGDLQTVQLPDLCCQPGMSGVFKLSDLPPVGKIEGRTKKFTVELRPLTPAATSIPPLEFSYFDPESQKYETLRSSAIPISVAELKAPQQQDETKEPASQPTEDNSWQPAMQQPALIDVEGNYPLDVQDLKNLWFSSWWALLIVPLGIFALWYQHNLIRYLAEREEEEPVVTSQTLFDEAWKEKPHTSPFYAKLYEAFFVRLRERGDIGPEVDSIDKLPATGASGDVKALLLAVEESRYAGDKGVSETMQLDRARKLFQEIGAKR